MADDLSDALSRLLAQEQSGILESQEAQALCRRLDKAGYSATTPGASWESLAKRDSLMVALPCFLNRDERYVQRRHALRVTDAINHHYETNCYLLERRLLSIAPPVDPRSSLAASQSRWSSRSRVDPSTLGTALENVADADADATSAPEASSLDSSRLRGFTKEFIELAVGLSFFKVSRVAHIAANDFLRDPLVMMATYIELSEAVTALADSGQLSLAASMHVRDLATWFALAPAACLDYFDALYKQSDVDGEYIGFAISGHLLRNTSTLDPAKKACAHLPITLKEPLAPIVIAIKHGCKRFIAQPVVHKYLRAEFVGGGVAEFVGVPPHEKRRVVLVWLCAWPLILAYNLCIGITASLYPPFGTWYKRRVQYNQLQTHQRRFWGGCFIPAFAYTLTACGELLVALAFTCAEIMPFRSVDSEETPFRSSTHRHPPFFPSSDKWATFTLREAQVFPIFSCLVIYSVAAAVDELMRLYARLFRGVEVLKPLKRLRASIHEAQQSCTSADKLENELRVASRMERAFSHAVQRLEKDESRVSGDIRRLSCIKRSSSSRAAGGRLAVARRQEGAKSRGVTAEARNTDNTSVASGTLSEDLCRVLKDFSILAAASAELLWGTLIYQISWHQLPAHLADRGFDLVTKALVMSSLFDAWNYDIDDLNASRISYTAKEAWLAYTVTFLWLRQMKILQVFSITGSFVVMLIKMVEDMLRWLLIFAFSAMAFAAGLHILFRNGRWTGGAYRDVTHMVDDEDCAHIAMHVSSVGGGLLFLVQVLLEGSDSWTCFSQSAASDPGLLLYALFLTIATLILLNTLIAMMTESFTNIAHDSFSNYAFSFSKVLVAEHCGGFNLLGMPYLLCSKVRGVCGMLCRAKTHADAHERGPKGATVDGQSDDEAFDILTAIRRRLIEEPSKKQQFERSIARFCSIQEDDEPLEKQDVADIVRGQLVQTGA